MDDNKNDILEITKDDNDFEVTDETVMELCDGKGDDEDE